MSGSQHLKENLELIKSKTFGELLKNHKKIVYDTYREVFGSVCGGCPDKEAGYVARLKNVNIDNIMKKVEAKFQLKKDVLIPVLGTSESYSYANLTDEVALKLLKENPNLRSLFLKFPDNIDELLSQEDETGMKDNVSIGDGIFSLEEALLILKNNDITTKATTVKGVQAKIKEVEGTGTVINIEKPDELLSQEDE